MANPPSQYYVDPTSGSDSTGDGLSDATAWATVQHALNNITRNTSHGDRINIKAGSADTISTPWSLTTYGSPASGAPLIFQGYTSTASDGGVAVIDLNAAASTLWTPAGNCVSFVDLEIHNGLGTGPLLQLNQYSSAVRCYVHGNNQEGIKATSSYVSVIGCRIEDVGSSGYSALSSTSPGFRVMGCYIKQGGARTMDWGIFTSAQYGLFCHNIISVDSTSGGIFVSGGSAWNNTCFGNTIFSNGGSGAGIAITNINATIVSFFANNYIEGFSATGGKGIDQSTGSSSGWFVVINNAFYNCATNYVRSSEHGLWVDEESLSSSGIAKSGSDTYANRLTYFAPVSSGTMLDGGWPEDVA